MSAIGTWTKLPANWNKQPRYFVLADSLEPHGAHLPPALWSFCANMAPNGDVSQYTAQRLARELEYRGPDPEAMKAKLVEAGYITKSGQVVGWVGEMFMLEKYREKARKAGRASAEKKRQATAWAGLSDLEEKRTSDQRTEDETRGDGDVEHDVEPDVQPTEENDEPSAAGAAPASVNPKKLTDAEWLGSLKINPAFSGIDVEREAYKCRTWCETKRKHFTRPRFNAWLNRIDTPIAKKPGRFDNLF